MNLIKMCAFSIIVPAVLLTGCGVLDEKRIQEGIEFIEGVLERYDPRVEESIPEIPDPVFSEDTSESVPPVDSSPEVEPIDTDPVVVVRTEPPMPPDMGYHPKGEPRKIGYKFTFENGGTLQFYDNHIRDYWGDFPNLGNGTYTSVDGSTRFVNVNEHIRKTGLRGKAVTLTMHGQLYHWKTPQGKRVAIFEDGYHPYVARGVWGWAQQQGYGAVVKSEIFDAHWMR